jgi:hypothetical protein
LRRCKQKIAPGGSEFPCSFFSLNVAYPRMRWYARGLKEIAKTPMLKLQVLLQDILTITRNLTIKASGNTHFRRLHTLGCILWPILWPAP